MINISTEYDFTDCKYNPRVRSFADDITDGIPAFKGYDGEHRENVFAYIVALYDKHSPLWAKVPEYFERKVRAADICHMPRSGSGGFSEFTREVLEGRSAEVNALCVAYLADLGDMDYMTLINEIAMYHSVSQQALGGSTKKELYLIMQELSKNIRYRTRQVFGTGDRDELTKVRILLYESAEKDRRRLNPEAVVSMLEKEGDFPGDWGRYGSSYKPDDIKFYVEDDK